MTTNRCKWVRWIGSRSGRRQRWQGKPVSLRFDRSAAEYPRSDLTRFQKHNPKRSLAAPALYTDVNFRCARLFVSLVHFRHPIPLSLGVYKIGSIPSWARAGFLNRSKITCGVSMSGKRRMLGSKRRSSCGLFSPRCLSSGDCVLGVPLFLPTVRLKLHRLGPRPLRPYIQTERRTKRRFVW